MVAWAEKQFTDTEVSEATGFSKRMLRQLATENVIKPLDVGRGRGKRRLYDHAALVRIIIIAALAEHGIPISVVCNIVMFAPYENDLIEYFQRLPDLKGAEEVVFRETAGDYVFELINLSYAFIKKLSDVFEDEEDESEPVCFGRIYIEDDEKFFQSWLISWIGEDQDLSQDFDPMDMIVEITFADGAKKKLNVRQVQYMSPDEITVDHLSDIEKVMNSIMHYNVVNLSMLLRSLKKTFDDWKSSEERKHGLLDGLGLE